MRTLKFKNSFTLVMFLFVITTYAEADNNPSPKLDALYVNEGQSNSITSDMIVDGTITFADIGQNSCTANQVIKRNQTNTSWMCSAESSIAYANVAVVAQSGGDYTDPLTAMNNLSTWCGTPSASNPCLLKIMPGIYDIGVYDLQMQNYVDIEGSGENTTKIKGNIGSGSSGVVRGANNAEIRFLTVENTGGGYSSTAIYNTNTDASPKMTNITAIGTGGTVGYGIINHLSSPTMTNVTAIGSGAIQSYGIVNSSCSATMITVTATGLGGTQKCFGVFNIFSSPTMTNVTATGSGGVESYGVGNSGNSTSLIIMTNLKATGTGGSINRGVYNYFDGTVRIDHSVITGSTNTIYNEAGVTTYVGNTKLDGGTVFNNSNQMGVLICAGVYDENYLFYANTCP